MASSYRVLRQRCFALGPASTNNEAQQIVDLDTAQGCPMAFVNVFLFVMAFAVEMGPIYSRACCLHAFRDQDEDAFPHSLRHETGCPSRHTICRSLQLRA